jgi:hypothetical protein
MGLEAIVGRIAGSADVVDADEAAAELDVGSL